MKRDIRLLAALLLSMGVCACDSEALLKAELMLKRLAREQDFNDGAQAVEDAIVNERKLLC